MAEFKQTPGMIAVSLLVGLSICMIFVGAFTIGTIQDYKPKTIATITDKTSYTITQGFFSSRTAFYIITDKGNFEVGRSGGNEADVYALWSRMKVGHTYNLDISMALVIGATEVY